MRRQARQWALMILYGMDIAKKAPERAVAGFFEAFGTGAPIDPAPSWDLMPAYRVAVEPNHRTEAEAFALDRVQGVDAFRDSIDEAIRRVSRNWRLERMAVLDRNVLRLGAFELLYRGQDVPRKVAINEAVELAKTFGSAESGAFVNGLLDRVGAFH